MSQSPRKFPRLKRSRKFSRAHDQSDDARRAEADAHNGARDGAPEGPPDSEEGYTVGYRRPPKHTQFKQGESGNPKGRSLQSRSLKTIAKLVLNEQTPVRVGGRRRRMGKMEALFRITYDHAVKGDPKAVTALFVMMKLCGYGTEAVESDPEFLNGIDHEAVLAEFLGRTKLDPPASADSSSDDDPTEAPAPSKKEKA